MIFQTQSTALRHLATAHLAQTMTLLSLNAAELRQKIESELASNPALELSETTVCPTCHKRLPERGPCPLCSRPVEPVVDEPIVFVSPRDDFLPTREPGSPEDIPDEELAAEVIDLPAFVMRQIAPELAPQDRSIAAHILTSLDDDGLLTIPLLEIARFHHVLISRIESVLHLIQRSEPVGVGSASPQDALLVQLEILADTRPIPALAERAVREGMEFLSRRQYSELGRLLGIPTAQVKQIAKFISENLNPYPARAHWGDVRQLPESNQDAYHLPDVIITRLNSSPNSPLVVEIVSPLAGKLRINPLFRSALQDAPTEKAEQWKSDLEQANLLIKCLQQRDHTIVRLMQRLAAIQRRFILQGDAHLEPVTRASLATELEVHESTISRAVSSKSVQLPSGRIVPLAKFFDRSLHIRTALRQIIAQETKPLTDTQLAKILKNQGFRVARRTVAKYRAMEGILPAHLRHASTNRSTLSSLPHA